MAEEKLQMHSPNLVQGNIKKIAELFPNTLTEVEDENGNVKQAIDFDILNKNVYILCSKGAEYNTLVKAIRDRAKATVDFTNTDISVVMNILLGKTIDEVGVEDDNT